MYVTSRMLGSICVLAALLLTSISLPADWLVKVGVRIGQFGDIQSLLDEQSKGQKLASEARFSYERVFAKGRIAEALLNREMSLIDAAACFRALHEDLRSWHHPLRARPEYQDGEAWCREVIEWSENYISNDLSTGQAEVLRRRLETELQAHLIRHGSVTLPEG